MPAIKTTAIVLLSVLSLWLIWSQFQDIDKKPPPTLASAQTGFSKVDTVTLNRLDSLEAELYTTRSDLQQLEQRLLQLEQKEEKPGAQSSETKQAPTPVSPTHDSGIVADPETLQDRLLANGIPFDTVQRIQQQIGQSRLAQLQLRDQATRENWINTPEYYEKVQELSNPAQSLREELGDAMYDRYLYASGRPNRVIVSEVYAGSAAAIAGIKSRDIILGYALEPVYSMSDLQQATVKGQAGELVLLEVLRDDAPFTTSVPRGPLGISMTISRVRPQ